MTNAQKDILLRRVDAVAERYIPECARWQMAHRPYGRKEGDTVGDDKGASGGIQEQ